MLAVLAAASELGPLVGNGGGARWNRALSCASVSLINAVMSWVESRALVKILGPWKGNSAIELAHSEICSRCEERSEAMVAVV